MEQFDRTIKLIGEEALQKLRQSHVAVFGLGGVGSYVCEALARAGVGTLTVVDCDKIDETNINRQLYALKSTVGQYKTDVCKSRIADINPNARVFARCCRFDGSTQGEFDFTSFDYVVDAIDTVTSKLLLAELCSAVDTPIVSCMGTGNKLDAAAFEVADIYDTSVCPLAKVMRKELKSRNVPKLKVVFSKELPVSRKDCEDDCGKRKIPPASISFVPPVAGFILAGEVVKDLIAYGTE